MFYLEALPSPFQSTPPWESAKMKPVSEISFYLNFDGKRQKQKIPHLFYGQIYEYIRNLAEGGRKVNRRKEHMVLSTMSRVSPEIAWERAFKLRHDSIKFCTALITR